MKKISLTLLLSGTAVMSVMSAHAMNTYGRSRSMPQPWSAGRSAPSSSVAATSSNSVDLYQISKGLEPSDVTTMCAQFTKQIDDTCEELARAVQNAASPVERDEQDAEMLLSPHNARSVKECTESLSIKRQKFQDVLKIMGTLITQNIKVPGETEVNDLLSKFSGSNTIRERIQRTETELKQEIQELLSQTQQKAVAQYKQTLAKADKQIHQTLENALAQASTAGQKEVVDDLLRCESLWDPAKRRDAMGKALHNAHNNAWHDVSDHLYEHDNSVVGHPLADVALGGMLERRISANNQQKVGQFLSALDAAGVSNEKKQQLLLSSFKTIQNSTDPEVIKTLVQQNVKLANSLPANSSQRRAIEDGLAEVTQNAMKKNPQQLQSIVPSIGLLGTNVLAKCVGDTSRVSPKVMGALQEIPGVRHMFEQNKALSQEFAKALQSTDMKKIESMIPSIEEMPLQKRKEVLTNAVNGLSPSTVNRLVTNPESLKRVMRDLVEAAAGTESAVIAPSAVQSAPPVKTKDKLLNFGSNLLNNLPTGTPGTARPSWSELANALKQSVPKASAS